MKLTGVLIDPFAKAVRQVEVEDDLHAWHALLQCELVAAFPLTPHVDLWIDEEGLFKEPPNQAYFYIAGSLGPIAGRALILGHDERGKSRSLKTGVDEIVPHVQFINTNVPDFRVPHVDDPEIWELDKCFNPIRRLD